jgi:hypothetical protein
MSRRQVLVGTALIAAVAACGSTAGPIPTDPPATPVAAAPADITPVPGDGSLAGACPSLEQAKAAVPVLVSGPEVNTEPFKTMVLQCNYGLDGPDVQGRQAGIGILVFDASAEGPQLWASVRTDPSFPNATDIPDLAEVAFATGKPGYNDIWVVQGRYGFHMSHLRQGGIPLDQMVALARAMVAGLGR